MANSMPILVWGIFAVSCFGMGWMSGWYWTISGSIPETSGMTNHDNQIVRPQQTHLLSIQPKHEFSSQSSQPNTTYHSSLTTPKSVHVHKDDVSLFQPNYSRTGCYAGKSGSAIGTYRIKADQVLSSNWCASKCFEQGYSTFAVYGGVQCWCKVKPDQVATPTKECNLQCGAMPESPMAEPGTECGGRKRATTFLITQAQRPTITVYIEPAKTRSTLFLTGRFLKYSSGKYRYNTVTINGKLSKPDAFREEVCIKEPGLKLFVGHGELALSNWPGNATWIVTGDEAGDWGLKRNGKYYGLHGPNSMFNTNESHPLGKILLPEYAKPMFRQYYDTRQVEAFGDDVRFLPLGSRIEFPDITENQIYKASERKYTYNLMISITDPSRDRLRNLLKTDSFISNEKSYVKVSENWHSNAGHEEYVNPDLYAKVILDSVFTLCPKGHSVEQFRIYEAIEAGSIPVLELNGNYLRSKLPPEYFGSGMLFVERWEDATEAMKKLALDKQEIDSRQSKLRSWYHTFMADKLREIEEVLETRASILGSVCKTH